MNSRTTRIAAAAGAIASIAYAATAQVPAAPTKANGDFIAGNGIPSNDFIADIKDVAVYLKPRARSNGQPLLIDGNTYIVLDGPAPSSTASWWSFDFQFTPRPGDTVGGENYNLTLEVDLDPSPATDFVVISQPLFDADSNPLNSWDDGDGLFINPGPGQWSDDTVNYVYSQSWRPDFGFLNGSILPAGDYKIRLTAAPTSGNIEARTVSTEVNVRVMPAGDTAVTLDTQDNCLANGEDQLVVDVNLSNAQATIVGGQFFLEYDNTRLDFVSAEPGDAPFSLEVAETVDEVAGEIFYAVGVPLGGTGTNAATTMARLTFDITGDFCAEDALLAFRTGVLPSRVTDANGTDIQPATADLGTTTKDSVMPFVFAPADVSVYADAGFCSAILDNTENFDTDPPLAPTQAPGVWYTDRYAPAAFDSQPLAGDDRLRIGISDADSQANRPASFSSAFYNTQGRKYDVDIPAGQKWSAKLWIPTDWATTVRRSDIWATTVDSTNSISGYPIIGFISNDTTDPTNPTPAGPLTPRFRVYTQDTDQDAGNGLTPDWIDLGLPSGFSYDRWWTLEVELTSSAYIFRVIDDTDTVVLSFTDAFTFGSIRASNIIMQAYNFGESYDVYWDDVTTGPAGAVATDGCSNVTVTYQRSDNPDLSLADPFPTGPTTVTWTATDACGNSATAAQIVTVDPNNLMHVEVELQAIVATGPFDRCITFELTPVGGGAPVIVNQTMTFNAGYASDTIEVPCGDYECITARDALHTLRKTDDAFTTSGVNYVASFTSSDGDELTGGNLNDDSFIDILDFGLFVGQFGTTPGANTACGFVGPHADISGDGVVELGDFSFIQINFLEFSELNCSGILLSTPTPGRLALADHVPLTAPLTSVTLEELAAMGMPDLAQADLNHDGLLDPQDITAFLLGARPDRIADVDDNGIVNFFDLIEVVNHLGQPAGLPYDMNGDGAVTIEDLHFVRDRLGMTFAD
ncbi:MAG: hypothetical protein D6692_07935 [Planctomycetota bacterium]|nr:MAG: hypothetical protein D6692_07935 [Planctomycetota bacterium]